MTEIFDGLPGVRVYVDDILIRVRSKKKHYQRLWTALEAAQHTGIISNKDKCQFAVQDASYLGDRITKEGVEPDPKLVTSMLKMPTPTNKRKYRAC